MLTVGTVPAGALALGKAPDRGVADGAGGTLPSICRELLLKVAGFSLAITEILECGSPLLNGLVEYGLDCPGQIMVALF